MSMQRIRQMQNTLGRQPRQEVPGVNLARRQGQMMNTNNGAGVTAMRQGLQNMGQPPGRMPPAPPSPQGGQPSPFSPNWQPPGKPDPVQGGRLAGHERAQEAIQDRRNRMPGKPQVSTAPAIGALRAQLSSSQANMDGRLSGLAKAQQRIQDRRNRMPGKPIKP